MSKQFFVRSKRKAWGGCDRCGRPISDIGDGRGWFNPKPRARIRNICDDCYAAGMSAKQKHYDEWLAKVAKHKLSQAEDAETRPYTAEELRKIAGYACDDPDGARAALLWCADMMDGGEGGS